MITTHEILPSYPRWRHGGSVRAFVGGEVTLFFFFGFLEKLWQEKGHEHLRREICIAGGGGGTSQKVEAAGPE